MKSMRVPFYIAIGVALLGVILGSFLDLSLSNAIANTSNTFGLIISVIGPTIGFSGFAFLGGGFIAFAIKQEQKVYLKVMFYLAAAIALGVAIYYAGREYFSINGFYQAAPNFVGFIIAGVCACGALVGGYFAFRKCENPNAWIALLIVYVVFLIALMGAVNSIKSFMHRPRYRIVVDGNVPYHEWWDRCSEYKEYMATYGYTKEQFKSFPSGHTTEASMIMVIAAFLPLADPRMKKVQLPLFIGAGAFTLLVGFARILVGAHFLSDISMGALLDLLVAMIANEVAIHLKWLHQ